MKRFKDALGIQAGACNPHGITRSLLAALDECRAEGLDTNQTCADPAIRLIVHQLAFLTDVSEIDNAYAAYSRLVNACVARSRVVA